MLEAPLTEMPNPDVIPKMVYVSFSAEINSQTTESLIATMSGLVNRGVPSVYLMLSTPGGAVMAGMNLYNILRGLPIDLTTHNVGNVDSIGNTVFQAGSKRYACPHSTFMFHGVGLAVEQMRLKEKFLAERLQSIRADQKRIASIILERSDLTPEAMERIFLEGQTIDAAEASKFGLVDEVRDIEIPVGSTIVSLVFKR